MDTSANTNNTANTASDRRQQVLLGDLPGDFLRVGDNARYGNPQTMQVQADAQAAQALQLQMAGAFGTTQTGPRLSVTLDQAKLVKNYGLVKMDPYCRVRIAHSVFETHTSLSGGKNPRWNKTFHCPIPQGVDSLHLEIFDEKAFTSDDKVAWSLITVPEKVFTGDTVDEWFPLNGRQGDSREGSIHLIFSYVANAPQPAPMMYNPAPVMFIPGAAPMYYAQQPQQVVQQPHRPAGPLFTNDDVKQVKDMFPDTDEEVIKSLLEANRGNKDATINNLLSMESS